MVRPDAGLQVELHGAGPIGVADRRDAEGLNLVRTVFLDCMTHYLTEGPEALAPVGETTFVRQVAEENPKR